MIDWMFAGPTLFNFLTAIGFVIYCWRLVRYFRGGRMVKPWTAMLISGVILVMVSSAALIPAFQLGDLPIWWRDFSASFFRVALFVTVIVFFRTWTTLDETKRP